MSIAVRYYSRSGNTKLLAEAIAESVNAVAIGTDKANAPIIEPVDTLFIGGALYAYGIDANLQAYLDDIDPKNVRRAVVFSTSWISKHAIDIIKKSLKAKGITVEEQVIYAKGKPSEKSLSIAGEIAKQFV